METMKNEKVELREFTQADWFGFAGAEKPEGAEPLVGEMRVNGRDVLVVVDATGISIEGEGGSLAYISAAFRLGRHVASGLPREVSTMYLQSIGFRVEQ